MIRVLWLSIAFFATGCQTVRVGDLRKDFSRQDYSKIVEAENYNVEVRYIPRLQRLVERMGWQDSVAVTRKILDSLMQSEPSSGLLFKMSIRPKFDSLASDISQDLIYGKVNGYGDYRSALQSFQFGLQRKIWIENRDRKIPLSQFHMENFFGLTRGREFLLMFPALSSPTTEESASFTFVMDDLVPGLSRRKIRWELHQREI